MARRKRKPKVVVQLPDKKPVQATSRGFEPFIGGKSYEASSYGRRLGSWQAPNVSPTHAVTNELDILRQRSRAAIRNNPWVNRALKVAVSNEIGTGIVPRARSDSPEFNEQIMRLWDDYRRYADYAGNQDIYGIQRLATRARHESGECFIRIIRQRPNRSNPVPVQFQVLESDYCPTSLNKLLDSGNEIRNGVEIDNTGRPVAYWLYRKHPSEGHIALNDTIRVKAEDVIHHFIAHRPGQLRGEPSGLQSLVRAYVFDKYDDAELGRKESRANFTGVIRRPDYGEEDYNFDPISGQPIKTDNSDVPMLEMETGTFPNLLPGEDITLFDGDDAGRGYRDYQHYQLLGIAAGFHVPYQLMSGDYTEINDRVWRAIMNQYHREVEQVQDLEIIPQICQRIWIEFVDRAIMSGAIDYPEDYADNRFNYLRCDHRPQAWKHIHPTQDVEAKIMEIDNGLASRQKVIDETRGESVEEIDKQRAEDQKRELDLGINQIDQTSSLDSGGEFND
jgi:lambda family phage portal protein